MFASWLYFIGNKENKSQIFLYGLSLPTDNNVAMNSKPQKIGRLSSGEEIYLFFSIINTHPKNFCQNNNINFNSINNKLAIEANRIKLIVFNQQLTGLFISLIFCGQNTCRNNNAGSAT